MTSLRPDSWDRERHLNIKRWERGAQRAALKIRAAETAAPPLPFPWRNGPDALPSLRPAYLLAFFSGDIALARFAAVPDGLRLVRGGFPWERWTPHLLNAYLHGARVPEPFRPLRRLPADWLEKALTWAPADQHAFFEKLRESGVLPPLRIITAEAVAPWMPWEEARTRFLDFREGKNG